MSRDGTPQAIAWRKESDHPHTTGYGGANVRTRRIRGITSPHGLPLRGGPAWVAEAITLGCRRVFWMVAGIRFPQGSAMNAAYLANLKRLTDAEARRAEVERYNLTLQSCECCSNKDVPHHMTECSICRRRMCPRCLYLPSIYHPCHCPACRS